MTNRVCFVMIVAFFWSGCSTTRVPSSNEQSRALELVDSGTLHLREGKLKDADASFTMALELAPLPQAVDGLGCVRFLAGKYDEAEEFFMKAYEMDSNYGNALGNLALLYESNGQKEKARRLYQRALNEDKENFRVKNNFAVFLSDKDAVPHNGETKAEVEHLLRKARALSPHPLIESNMRLYPEK